MTKKTSKWNHSQRQNIVEEIKKNGAKAYIKESAAKLRDINFPKLPNDEAAMVSYAKGQLLSDPLTWINDAPYKETHIALAQLLLEGHKFSGPVFEWFCHCVINPSLMNLKRGPKSKEWRDGQIHMYVSILRDEFNYTATEAHELVRECFGISSDHFQKIIYKTG